MSVSLDKTAKTIAAGRKAAEINAGLRRNDLRALSARFGK
ncbi:hypothetical protein SEA_GOBY_75 [Streptomyces phage Goby]|uniref:Uncharacterized protein n=3 Tax=Likavirus TaxID=1982880 RepID=R4TMV2_9CAUD|nr:hypothetical protein M051_gp74 [Streptomyces phage Lika]YP_010056628.1 hypothetical protein KGH00_gp75 [Streptomyces phage Goby]AOQ27050.1 hypothetical protein SEA_GODPOWER_75 [Streptomyces phage Godpower]ATE85179.1 hypothetical protein SEA_DATTRAN_76 [Streptomyces phage Dattran]AWN07669.1 hypothetical protein SEA_TOMA_75 [Streptomyces phage Toma]AGM12097.1 hypothetical protein LIKA_74 [Streptomyces phage Lika]AWN07593.1 hypothetical protein SEA_GOBY_75 [Streptomyces phage Goby]